MPLRASPAPSSRFSFTAQGPGRSRIEIPDDFVEKLDPDHLPRWEEKESPAARTFGDRWVVEQRSAVLVIPAVPSRPIGRTVLINLRHADAKVISASDPFVVPWDERFF